MLLTVEISMYPLKDEHIAAIDDFIAGLNCVQGLRVRTTLTSTLVTGDYDLVFRTLHAEMARCYHAHGNVVYVAKIIPDYEAL